MICIHFDVEMYTFDSHLKSVLLFEIEKRLQPRVIVFEFEISE